MVASLLAMTAEAFTQIQLSNSPRLRSSSYAGHARLSPDARRRPVFSPAPGLAGLLCPLPFERACGTTGRKAAPAAPACVGMRTPGCRCLGTRVKGVQPIAELNGLGRSFRLRSARAGLTACRIQRSQSLTHLTEIRGNSRITGPLGPSALGAARHPLRRRSLTATKGRHRDGPVASCPEALTNAHSLSHRSRTRTLYSPLTQKSISDSDKSKDY